MAYNQGQSTVVVGSTPVQTSAPVSQPISGRGGHFQVETYKGRQSQCVGVGLIVVGILAVVFNIVDLAITAQLLSYERYASPCYFGGGGCIAHGFWGGILSIISGALAVAAGRNRTRGFITALLVLTIITMVATGVQTIIGAANAKSLYVRGDGTCFNSNNRHHDISSTTACQQFTALVAMEALMSAAGGIAFFLCLWASVLCCSGNGCCAGPTPGVTYAVVTTGPQMTIMSQQQYGQQQYGQQYGQPQMQQQQQQYPLVYNPATGSYSYATAPPQQYMVGPPSYSNVATPAMSSTPGYPPRDPDTSPSVTQPGYDGPPAEQAKY